MSGGFFMCLGWAPCYFILPLSTNLEWITTYSIIVQAKNATLHSSHQKRFIQSMASSSRSLMSVCWYDCYPSIDNIDWYKEIKSIDGYEIIVARNAPLGCHQTVLEMSTVWVIRSHHGDSLNYSLFNEISGPCQSETICIFILNSSQCNCIIVLCQSLELDQLH